MEIEKLKDTKNLDLSRFREMGMLGAIIILSLLVQSRNSEFFTLDNLSDLLSNTAILAILALGMMMVLISKGIDLSIGSTLALSGMVVTKLMISYPQIPIIIAIMLGILIGLACGSIVGALIAWADFPPIIASLGAMNVYRGITYLVSGGVWVSAHQMTDSFKKIASGKIFGISNLFIFAVVIYILGYVFLQYTKNGRRIYAVGSNPISAQISGIRTKRVLFMIYAIMGALAGLAGILWVSKFASAQGNTTEGYEMSVIASCVLGGVSVDGGVGKISGLILGVSFYGILSNSLPMLNISSFWQQAIQAILILGAVILNVIIKRKMIETNRRRRKI